ncbi:tRNA lysidine(34) synthetase TilS [Lactiplantibacillus xiangfangensis]|uniref:tRNA(Ile)-lysidine synthase n=1 Tax=Lactiplantibacillus xiangfangensis TaxID=942150 RepID=A0A0R2MBD0_9LACO|nr:tRNA lysidine(34) synthetase TilS [Lactiplantibacillus xiangfangensis]KRO11071.1 trna(ile)-lysidine synthase [Lactiplantibacillus xiangfangensis]
MTPVQQFNRQLARAQLLKPDVTVVVAVSTGVDSMVLLTLLQRLPVAQRPQIVVAHVNHHLRAQSQREAEFLQAYCARHDLTLRLADWSVAQHPLTGVEAAGRAFRYQFFTEVMRTTHASAVLTAHHANDQTETYLMKLARGGDLAQLTGIRPRRPFASGQLVRPLLTWSKPQIRKYAAAHQVTFFEDVTNQDVRLTRNRIRHRVVPELLAVNPELLTHVAAYERQLQTLLEAKQAMVTQLLPTVVGADSRLKLVAFNQVLPQWQVPVLKGWLEQRTGQLVSEDKLTPVRHWIQNENQPTGKRQISGNVDLVKRVGTIDVQPHKKRVKKLMPGEKTMVDLNQWQKITATQTVGLFTRMTEQTAQQTAQPLRLTDTDWPLYFRPWQASDQLTLRGGGHQSIRRILINQKVPANQRDGIYVLVNARGEALWVVGHKFTYRAHDFGTQTVFLALKHES